MNEVEKNDWMSSKWRPLMAVMYLLVCVFDFILFPVLWSFLQASYGGSVTQSWMPLTLQGAGLFHLAMGAILGISAWSRGQEKIASGTSYRNDIDASYYNEQRYRRSSLNHSRRTQRIEQENQEEL